MIYPCKNQGHYNQYNSGNTCYTEARNHKNFQKQQDDSHDKSNDLPIPGKPFEIQGSEIEQASRQGGSQRKTDPRGLQFEIDTTDNDHNQQSLYHGINQKTDNPIGDGRMIAPYRIVFNLFFFQYFLHTFCHSVTKTVFHGFPGSESHYPSAIGNTLDINRLIHHGFSDMRIPLPTINRIPALNQRIPALSFCRRTNHRAHIGLIFIGHRLTRLIHDRSRPDIRPLAHIDSVAGNRNQCPGRGCIIIDKYPYRFP